MKCSICGNEENNISHIFRESLYGMPDTFKYFQCSSCQCLQIHDIPSDFSKYYLDNYYSYSDSLNETGSHFSCILKNAFHVFSKGFYSKFKNLLWLFWGIHWPKEVRHLKNQSLNRHSKILDVGCGNGKFLYALRILGYKNILGIDPFLKETIHYRNGLKICKQNLSETTGKWDLIMFHHSYEHMPDPLQPLTKSHALLSDNGICVIRIPTVSSHAWHHYKDCWISIDAPRHCFLHSLKSMEIIAKKASFNIEAVIYDSAALQFWGSEQLKQKIPLFSESSYAVNKKKSNFGFIDSIKFNLEAIKLNKNKYGDSIVVFLKKNGESKLAIRWQGLL